MAEFVNRDGGATLFVALLVLMFAFLMWLASTTSPVAARFRAVLAVLTVVLVLYISFITIGLGGTVGAVAVIAVLLWIFSAE